MTKIVKLIVSLAVSFAAGAVGSLATIPNVPTWYAALDKPFFNPPNWVFGPVWTLLYALMGISLYLVWTARRDRLTKQVAYFAFGSQLVLNAAWSLVFFGLHALVLACSVIAVLIISIVSTMLLFKSISKTAFFLLVPYVAWTSFAAALTVAIALLNFN